MWLRYEDSNISEYISGFNNSNNIYKVQVEDISTLSEQQLNTKILAEEGPDLYFVGDNSGFAGINEEIIFENLLPYIDASTTVNRDSIVKPILKSAMDGEALYHIPTDFTIYTMGRKTNLMPEKNMDIMDALNLDAVKNGELSVFPKQFTQNDMWYWLSNLYISNHVDKENASCDFDTEDYKKLLMGCKTLGNVRQPDAEESIFSFEQIPGVLRLIYLQEKYQDTLSLESGEETAFNIEYAFAISNSSKNKEGAWKFMEYVMSADLQEQLFSWPASRVRLNSLLNKAKTMGIFDENTNDYTKLSQNSIDQILNLISDDSSSGLFDEYPELMRIAQEEAQKYFSGDKDVEETAEMTQSRATIYMAEQYS